MWGFPFVGGCVPFGAGDGFELVYGYGVVWDGCDDFVVVEFDVGCAYWVLGDGEGLELFVYVDVPLLCELDCVFEVGDGEGPCFV